MVLNVQPIIDCLASGQYPNPVISREEIIGGNVRDYTFEQDGTLWLLKVGVIEKAHSNMSRLYLT